MSDRVFIDWLFIDWLFLGWLFCAIRIRAVAASADRFGTPCAAAVPGLD